MTPTFLLFASMTAFATPQLTERAKEQARTITNMGVSDEPIGRLLMAMAVIEKGLDENARFALAGLFPNIVENAEDEKMQTILHFLISMPPTQNALRRGETILRTPNTMKTKEKRAANKMLTALGLSEKGFQGIRIGAFDRLRVTIQVNTKQAVCGGLRRKQKNTNWHGREHQ